MKGLSAALLKTMVFVLGISVISLQDSKALETVSSSSYVDVECSMVDHTCEKLLLRQAQADALNMIFDPQVVETLTLKKAISIFRNAHRETYLSDAQIIELIALGE
ncbi:MAG: hypothetical protein ACOYOK_00780 [Pseudobdellovibrionaceae bacterium]